MRSCIEITFEDVANNSTFYKGFDTTIFKLTVKISDFIRKGILSIYEVLRFLFFLVKFLFADASESK